MTLDEATRQDSEYILGGIELDGEGHVDMAVLCHGRRFHIEFGPADLREPDQLTPSKLEKEFVALSQAVDDVSFITGCGSPAKGNSYDVDVNEKDQPEPEKEDTNSYTSGCEEDALETWILKPFLQHHIFREFAPENSQPILSSLDDVINPPTLSFTLKVVHGELVPVRLPVRLKTLSWYSRPACMEASLSWSACPKVEPQDVPLIDRLRPQNTNFVMFRGKKCWFKPVKPDVSDIVYTREVDTLMQIKKIGLDNHIRVAGLQGLVMAKEAGHIYGFLLDAVSDGGRVWDRFDDPLLLRQQWYDDVTGMIRLLHSANIVWGDFKPQNMLIDKEDRVWLVDFGGGITHGWVDEEKMETMEGDLQGLARFKTYLHLEQKV
jgi:hypothetical protein